MSRPRIPDEVLEAAHARARAREARDWPEADRLKSDIEAAGWKVVDRGTDFALSPATPPDVLDGGRIRYGSSAGVPSRLDEAPVGLATVVVVATADLEGVARTYEALAATAPAGTSVVIVADGLAEADDAALRTIETASGEIPTEIIRTSERLGPAAALNAGVRRATGPVVISLVPAVEPTGDIVTPLVHALDDPTVAVAGGWGSVTRDGRRFEDGPPGGVDVIEAALLAFRRADAAERGPIDERLRTDRYAAIWWSLVLRDGGESGAHRGAVALSGLPVVHPEPAAPMTSDPARDGDLRRDFYRYLDRFGSRADLFGKGE